MEDILDLYESEYNPQNPVVCVDKKPYQLLDNRKVNLKRSIMGIKKKELAIFLCCQSLSMVLGNAKLQKGEWKKISGVYWKIYLMFTIHMQGQYGL